MRWRRRIGWCALAAVPLAVVAVFFLLPLGGMLHRGLWPGGRLDLGGVADVLGRRRIRRVLWFTVWSSGLATAITVLLGVPVAWVLHRLRFPGRGLLRVIVAVPFVLPTVVVGVAFRTLLATSGPLGFLGLDGTSAAIVMVLVFFNIAVVVRTVGAAWAGLDRRPAEAAAGLGASRLRVFTSITLPTLRPAIMSSAVIVFLFCATAFGVVLTLGGLRYATIETEIYLQTTQFLDLRAAATLSLLQLLLVIVLLALTSRARPVATESEFGAEGRPGVRDAGLLVATGLVSIFLAAPVVELVVRSMRRDGSWTLAAYRGLGGEVWSALRNSLTTAAFATAVSVLLALLASAVVSRTPRTRASRRALRALDAVFTLPLGVSAVTIGFGFLITLDHPPLDLRTSPVLVIVAQALVALPLVLRVLAPPLRAVPQSLRDAAATLGAGPLRTFAAVELPLVRRPLLAGTGFAFAVCLGEFGATSFLARPDRQTLPVLIYRYSARPGAENFQIALAASVLLAAVTVVVMLGVERLRVPSLGTF